MTPAHGPDSDTDPQGRRPPPAAAGTAGTAGAAGAVGAVGAAEPSEMRRQLAVAFDSAPVGMAVTAESGVLVQANDALARLLEQPVGELLGRRLEDLADPPAAGQISAGRAQMLTSGLSRHSSDSLLRRADGTSVPVCLTCARVPPTSTGPGYLIVHVQDTSEQVAAAAELTRRALHDPLTDLPNRTLLLDRLEQALARLSRQPSAVAVLFADLDDFKHVNDTYGHTAGDQVLVAVARRLQLLQRPGDTACRLGGDEFVVLCEDSGRSQADSVAKRIHAALATPIRWVSPPHRAGDPDRLVTISLTASLGIATTSDPATTAQQLLTAADTAMYRSKRGR